MEEEREREVEQERAHDHVQPLPLVVPQAAAIIRPNRGYSYSTIFYGTMFAMGGTAVCVYALRVRPQMMLQLVNTVTRYTTRLASYSRPLGQIDLRVYMVALKNGTSMMALKAVDCMVS